VSPKRIDDNHRAIVKALRQHPGVRVFSTAAVGKGVPDLCVGYQSFTILCEIKGAKGRLNPAQTEWHFEWTGTPVVILRTVDDVILLLRTLDHYATEPRALATALIMQRETDAGRPPTSKS